MLRYHPDEQPAITPLRKFDRADDRGLAEMGRHLAQVIIRYCYQCSKATDGGRRQEVPIPPRGAFAAVLYTREHGDLLISFDEKTAVVHDFTGRKTLDEEE